MIATVTALASQYPHTHGAWWPIFPIFWILFFVGIFGAILELAVFRPRRTSTYGTTGTTREVIRERDQL